MRCASASTRPPFPYLKRLEDISQRNPKDTPYKVLGRLRQGMVLDALGNRGAAMVRYNQVLRMKDWGGSRKAGQALPQKTLWPRIP